MKLIGRVNLFKSHTCFIADCLYDGRVYRNEQTFTQPGDRCKECTCSRGNIRCERTGVCPSLSCRVTETPPRACCPICKGRSIAKSSHCNISCDSTGVCPSLSCRVSEAPPEACCQSL